LSSSKLAQYGLSPSLCRTCKGIRMLIHLFPASSLKFRTVGFSQYGFKCKRLSAQLKSSSTSMEFAFSLKSGIMLLDVFATTRPEVIRHFVIL
jgi:hypothetical protein